jgi:hypothetical protein
LAITWGSEYVEILNTEIDHAGGAGGTKNSQGIYGAASHLLVDGANIHHNAGYGASNANSYPGLNAIDHITRNSRFYSNGQIVLPSGGLGGGLNEGEGSGHQIYNNLIYDNAGPGLIMAFESGSTGTQIYNNTIYGNGTYGIFIGTAETGVILYNNISYQNGFGNYTNSGTKTTEDRNSRLGVDPLFVNLGARDFKLQAGSPVINQGLTLSLVTTDFAGTTRPQGAAYDIGAYEYGSGVISSPPVITTTSLANGVVSVPYSRTLAATGGTGAYTWSVSVGALSAGLFLTPSTGLISGTPTTSGATSFTARVTDASGQFGTQALTLTVVGGVIITTNTPLPSAETAAAYSVTLAATGDAPPYVWSLANSTPPVGLTLSSAGVLSGTPSTAIADRFFTVRATGSLGSTTTQIVSMSVNSEYRPAFRPISRNTTEGFIFRRRTPPTNPADRVMRGDVWLDTSADPPVFKVCSEASATTAVWVTH